MKLLFTGHIRLTLMLLTAVVVFFQGCAGVLTSSQIQEVATFANAAKAYGDLPGEVIKSHGQLRANQKILQASTFTNGDMAIRQINSAVNIRRELDRRATAADNALEVMNDYASLLVKLTADTYTDDLQKSAENLGDSIDRGIGSYNDLRKSNLKTFGGLVAASVRGVGGLLIHYEQAKTLKKAIILADPVIDAMINEVEKLLALYLSSNDLKELKLTLAKNDTPLEQLDLVRNVETDLRQTYTQIVTNSGRTQNVQAAYVTADNLTNADNTIRLAVKALKAAETYRMAHKKLAENVTQRQWLSNSIDQVKTLVEEVNAAIKIKKKLEAQ